MNWTEITQSHHKTLWHIAEINYFPEGGAGRFLGYNIETLFEKTIILGSELTIGFWAILPDQAIASVTLYQSETWLEQTDPVPERPDLRSHFSDVPHAHRSSFCFVVKLNDTTPAYRFDVYLDLADGPFWFASIHLAHSLTNAMTPADLDQTKQISLLRFWATRKDAFAIDYVASTCAVIISICGEQTAPALFAMLGDALEAQGHIEPAIAAYRKAVELQPQEAKFEMRLSQLLTRHAQALKATATPKGISLSTSGETALTIIVDMLYRSTPSYMYARELFQNELDAIYRRWDKELEMTGQSDYTGVIRIGPNAENPKKLCFWGDGIGMTFDQVTNHLAKLVNSGNVAHTTGNMGEPSSPSNFGIGAKTSALPENTQGMVYRTLPFGESEGIEFAMWKNPNTFLYEIKAWENSDGVGHFRHLPISEFVGAIQRRGSGASATLLGNTPDEDTFAKSENLLSRWVGSEQLCRGVVYFLNSRYFTLPAAGLDVQVAKRATDNTLHWHTIIGQKAFLERYAEQHGTLRVHSGSLQVAVHWWILSETAQQEGSVFNALGHVGLLWKNELYYNPHESQRGQRLQLNGFGIHFGEERVVIYIEPTQPELVDSHPSRTKLMYGHRELNPSEFGESFAANMPPELEAYQKSFFSLDMSGESIAKIKGNLQLLGLEKEAKMRQFANSYFNKGKPKSETVNVANVPDSLPKPPGQVPPEAFDSHIPHAIWRDFDAEAMLFAAEWDKGGYVIKFNSAWPSYQKTLAMLVAEAQADYPDILETLLRQECEKQLRFDYFKTLVETLFNSYAMIGFSGWTEQMIDTHLLSPAGLSVALQFSSNLRVNVKTALVAAFTRNEAKT